MSPKVCALGLCALAPCSLVAAVAAPAPAAHATSVSPNVAVGQRIPAEVIQDFQSPSVALNPRDPSNVVVASRSDTPNFNCRIHFSTDGGSTWSLSSFPPPSRGACWAPAAAFDDANHVYVTAQDRLPAGNPQDIIVWSSADGGRTFGAPVRIPGSSGMFSVQPAVTVDITRTRYPGGPVVYVTWYTPRAPLTQIFEAVSEDGGVTWSDPLTKPVPGEFQFFPTPAVGPEGNLYVVYKDLGPFNSPCRNGAPESPPPGTPADCPIRVLRSTDGGHTFDSPAPNGPAGFQAAVAHFDDLSSQEAPGIVAAPNGDVLVTYASLPDLPTPAGCRRDLDVFVARSTDRGTSWSAPVRVNDDGCGSGAAQRDPWASVAPDGRIDVVFYDSRNDPDHVLTDATYASSSDGGRSFSSNRRVSDRSSDGRVMFAPKSTGFQSVEFDRNNGIASWRDGAVAAWGDSRNVFPNSPHGDPSTPSSDVVAARIQMARSGPAPVTRVAAADAYGSAVAFSRQTFSFAEAVVIASPSSLPHLLAGAPLARKLRAPLLLSPPDGPNPEVRDEISRLKPTTAYILGGTQWLSSAVEADLAALGVGKVIRIAGRNRYDTVARIAQVMGHPATKTAVVASGTSAGDNLAAAALAAERGEPLLLVKADVIPVETRQALRELGVDGTIVVGGKTQVSAKAITELTKEGRRSTGVSGTDRYDTAVKATEFGSADLSASPRFPANVAYLASGRDFAETLAAVPVVAYRGGILLLADKDASSASYLRAHKADLDKVVLVGRRPEFRSM